MLTTARDRLPGGNGKRVTVKAMPTPLTRMAARGFEVTHTEREAHREQDYPIGGARWKSGF